MKVLSLLFTVAIILGLSAFDSNAQGLNQQLRCQPRDSVLSQLTSPKYNEFQKFVGYVNKRSIIEIFINEETGTWTLFATLANGNSCLISSGPMHQFKISPLPGEPS